MQLAVPKPITREQFLAWEVRQQRRTKNLEYAAIRSVRRYVVLAQDEMAGILFERIDDDWVGHLLNADSLLRMPEIGIEIALTELYEEVKFLGAESVPHSH
jgi:hypothetical protein